MGALAVALARECYYGEDVMRGVQWVEGVDELLRYHMTHQNIHRVIFCLCPPYHNNTQKFDQCIWRKCKDTINHG